MAKIDHPSCAKLVDVATYRPIGAAGKPDTAYLCILMEHVADAVRLSELITSSGNAPLALHMLPQLGEALTHVHQSGFVHRDLWAENVLVGRNSGQVTLIDFGCAESLGHARPSQQYVNRPYASPEMWRSDRPQTGDDCWSLGLVITEVVTGRVISSRMGRYDLPIHHMPQALQEAIRETRVRGGPVLGHICERLLDLDGCHRGTPTDIVQAFRRLDSRRQRSSPVLLPRSATQPAPFCTLDEFVKRAELDDKPTAGASVSTTASSSTGEYEAAHSQLTPTSEPSSEHAPGEQFGLHQDSLQRSRGLMSPPQSPLQNVTLGRGASSVPMPTPALQAPTKAALADAVSAKNAPSQGRPQTAGQRAVFDPRPTRATRVGRAPPRVPSMDVSQTGLTASALPTGETDTVSNVSVQSRPHNLQESARSMPVAKNWEDGDVAFFVGQKVLYHARSHDASYPAVVLERLPHGAWSVMLTQSGAIREVLDAEVHTLTPMPQTGSFNEQARDSSLERCDARCESTTSVQTATHLTPSFREALQALEAKKCELTRDEAGSKVAVPSRDCSKVPVFKAFISGSLQPVESFEEMQTLNLGDLLERAQTEGSHVHAPRLARREGSKTMLIDFGYMDDADSLPPNAPPRRTGCLSAPVPRANSHALDVAHCDDMDGRQKGKAERVELQRPTRGGNHTGRPLRGRLPETKPVQRATANPRTRTTVGQSSSPVQSQSTNVPPRFGQVSKGTCGRPLPSSPKPLVQAREASRSPGGVVETSERCRRPCADDDGRQVLPPHSLHAGQVRDPCPSVGSFVPQPAKPSESAPGRSVTRTVTARAVTPIGKFPSDDKRCLVPPDARSGALLASRSTRSWSRADGVGIPSAGEHHGEESALGSHPQCRRTIGCRPTDGRTMRSG